MAEKTALQKADEVIIRYADIKSVNEISFMIDGLLSPSQVHSRINQLLDTPDWLSSAQLDQLVTHKMRLIIAELMEQNLTARNAEVILNGLEKVANRLDKRSAATESDLQKLYAFQGAALLDAISDALDFIRRHLSSLAKGPQHAEITEADWDLALEGGIRHAQLKLAVASGETEESLAPAAPAAAAAAAQHETITVTSTSSRA